MFELEEIYVDEVVDYLHNEVQDCIYMFIDIKKYRLTSPAMKVWYSRDSDEKLSCVVMKYHTSLSIYAKDLNYPLEEVLDIIRVYKPLSITAKKSIAEMISEVLDDSYATAFGYVFRIERFNDFGGSELVETATEDDVLEIAKLITSDKEFGAYYDVNDLANQLKERMSTGMGRNYIIKSDGRIVGNIATFAELDDVATTSALIVAKEYEGKMYGAVLESYMVNRLKEEGYNVYTFIDQKKRYKLLSNLGNFPVGEYGKLMKKEDA